MYLRHLVLVNFRNYTRLELTLPARIHLFQGENAQGKTNLLEAIYCLATTKSPLAASDRQLVSWSVNQEILPFTSISGDYTTSLGEHSLDITIVQEPSVDPERILPTIRKQVRVDGVPRRLIDGVGKLKVVLFLPEDVGLVAGAPSGRRHFLDISLCQLDATYCRCLTRYQAVLTQRNALLRQIRDRQAQIAELEFWTKQIVAQGSYVLAMRNWFTSTLSRYLDELLPALTSHLEKLELEYVNSVFERVSYKLSTTNHCSGMDSACQADTLSVFEEQFRHALDISQHEEVLRATTIAGPHRDDLRFKINGFDAADYGSRGQQRTITLALKLAEVKLMQEQIGESPVLLLDDIFSELDQRRSQLLLSLLSDADQVLITTTDLNACDSSLRSNAQVWHVAGGEIKPLY
ncbi:MAG: DNA replication/repair protein RecF [Anaerolineae bacterium]